MLRKLLPLTTAALMLGTAMPALAAGELTYVVNNESATFDPSLSTETFALPVIGATFEGLVKFAPDNSVVPALAESWEISDDGLTYTFHLRDDAKWSDGKPVTAGDFVYAWKRVLTPEAGAKNAPILYAIDGAEDFYNGESEDVAISALDDKTLTFTLKAPVAYMLQLLPFQVFDPVREDLVAADPDGWTRDPATFVGTGPFRVTEFNFGKSTVLEKNPNYYDADAVSLDKLTFPSGSRSRNRSGRLRGRRCRRHRVRSRSGTAASGLRGRQRLPGGAGARPHLCLLQSGDEPGRQCQRPQGAGRGG